MEAIKNLIYKYKLFIKYCIVGGTAAVVDFGILFILTDFFSVYYLTSATASFIVSALVNYSLNRSWTFQSNGIMYTGVEFFGLWYILAKVIATGVVLIWNFLGNKYFTFKVYENNISG